MSRRLSENNEIVLYAKNYFTKYICIVFYHYKNSYICIEWDDICVSTVLLL